MDFEILVTYLNMQLQGVFGWRISENYSQNSKQMNMMKSQFRVGLLLKTKLYSDGLSVQEVVNVVPTDNNTNLY